MTKIIKKLQKNNINFAISNGQINFKTQDNIPYTITKINNNKYLINSIFTNDYITYKLLIKILNKYQMPKKW